MCITCDCTVCFRKNSLTYMIEKNHFVFLTLFSFMNTPNQLYNILSVNTLLQAATFHYDMVYKVAKATSDEVRAKNNNATAHQSYAFHTGLSCWYNHIL